jgi:hypothetical protein
MIFKKLQNNICQVADESPTELMGSAGEDLPGHRVHRVQTAARGQLQLRPTKHDLHTDKRSRTCDIL